MHRRFIFVCIILLAFHNNASAISDALKKKYAHSLLTDDYHLLDESDLDSLKDGVYPPTCPPKEGFGYIYWQCFPRDDVTTTLEDEGYSSEDFGWEDNYGHAKITAHANSGIIHEYVMRRTWTTNEGQRRFDLWLKLMKNQKYVCLAGSYITKENNVIKGKKQQKYIWVFEKLKTRRGRDSYF